MDYQQSRAYIRDAEQYAGGAMDLINIKEPIQQAIRLLGEQKAYDSMQRILRKLAPDRAETEKMLETAQSANDSRCVSILMNELQKHGRKQRKAFEL